jgi:hypothetical protein
MNLPALQSGEIHFKWHPSIEFLPPLLVNSSPKDILGGKARDNFQNDTAL